MNAKAPLIEVFTSIQGEGRHVGVPTTFVRVAVCPIRCGYCDTPNSYVVPKQFPVEVGGAATQHDNPVTAERAAQLVGESSAASRFGAPEWVSVTGGEPLLYPEFVRQLGAAWRAGGGRLALETAALDPAALARCIDQVDHLSADYKLPGTLLEGDAAAAGLRAAECVAIAADRSATIDVKLVLTAAFDESALADAWERLRTFRERIVVVLQPVTPFGAATRRCPPERVARVSAAARRAGFAVRVLPQVHPVLGLR
ncbi:MAG: 7-carboxy-7-deazaguanine synthase QueE [Planctomycetes bacterium]|nr:7-carboxy-7-deazaguanine synthase QueE [Planctomycetota bacterium]